MSATPRTDAEAFLPHDSKYRVCDADFCRKLERELNAANSKIEALNRGNANAERILCEAAGVGCGRDVLQWIVAAREKIKRLEEEIVNERSKYKLLADDARAVVKAWEKAKEAKP